jgi:LacI family transcriptional regulator
MSTIREVAEAAHVSPATVSRVLNGKASALVSAGTRQRVLTAAEQLGYRPSAAARALVAGATRTVALTTTLLHDPHYARMLSEVQDLIRAHEYHLLLVPDEDDRELENLLSSRRADVLVRLRYPVDVASRFLSARATPRQVVIAVGPVEANPPEDCFCAYWDDREGIEALVEHLAGLGHRHLAYLAIGNGGRKRRFAAEAARLRGLTCEVVSVQGEGEENLHLGHLLACRAVSQAPAATALMCPNDTVALGALHGLHHCSRRVPEDLSLTGYNDTAGSAFSIPALTTIRTPLVECMTSVLDEVLSSLGAKQELRPSARRFATQPVVRQSTAVPAHLRPS